MGYCRSRSAVAMAVFLTLAAGSAWADTLTPQQAAALTSFTYSSYSVVNEINVTISNSPGQNGHFGSGQIDLIGTSTNAGEVLATWCIDVFDDLLGSDHYNVVSTAFTNDGGRIGGALIGSPSPLGEIGALVHWGDNNLGPTINSAAVQLAIWTIEYPGASFISDNGAVNSLVPTLVSNAQNGSLPAFYGLGEVVDPGNNQGLVFEVGGRINTSLASPLPSTWTMMLIGFAGLGLLAYRGAKNRFTAVPVA